MVAGRTTSRSSVRALAGRKGRQASRAQRAQAPLKPHPPGAAPATASGLPGRRMVAAAPPLSARPDPAPFWTDFRGPRRDGHYDERRILTTWPSAGLKPMWKQPIGGGYASFVIVSGRAFTLEQRGNDEVVAAYDLATGRELWTNAWAAAFREFMGGDGPRATPTWHDGLVYALGAEGELRCLESATGRVVWRTNILADAGAKNLGWGMAASPLVVDNTVVVLPGGPNGQSVVAYDRRTGKRAWSALDDQQAYSSPMLVTLGGVRQLLVFTQHADGLTPIAGVFVGTPVKTQFDVNASQPLVLGENRVFISSGYGTGATVLELTPADNRFRSVKSGGTSG